MPGPGRSAGVGELVLRRPRAPVRSERPAVDDPLGKLRAIPVYYYDHISVDPATDTPVRTPDGTFDSSMTYGMSAAEVGAVVPELAGDSNVDYGRLMTILWSACQLLDSRLTALEGAAA